mgnify:CR=1 FL=1
MQELLKKYIEIAKLALLQEKAQADSPLKGMNEHEKEFLPAVLEVTETPPSHAARLLSYVIMSVFVITLLWAVFGKIDIIATAAGRKVELQLFLVLSELERPLCNTRWPSLPM